MRVYVKINDNVPTDINIRYAQLIARILRTIGASVYIPVLERIGNDYMLDAFNWMLHDLEWLECCEQIVSLEDSALFTDEELGIIGNKGIRFNSLKQLLIDAGIKGTLNNAEVQIFTEEYNAIRVSNTTNVDNNSDGMELLGNKILSDDNVLSSLPTKSVEDINISLKPVVYKNRNKKPVRNGN